MKYEISKEVVNNLLVFLDRIEIKGLKELQAMNGILDALQNPIKEESNKD